MIGFINSYEKIKLKESHFIKAYDIIQSIINRLFSEQPDDVINKKECFGEWEIFTDIGKTHKGAWVPIVGRKAAFFMMRKEMIPRVCPNKSLKCISRIKNQCAHSPLLTDADLLDIKLLLRSLIPASTFSIHMLLSKVDPMGILTNWSGNISQRELVVKL